MFRKNTPMLLLFLLPGLLLLMLFYVIPLFSGVSSSPMAARQTPL